jgi:1-deoxy-D-xylulose-5-phosphate synthase
MKTLAIGKGYKVREGQEIAIINFGTLLPAAIIAADVLGATVCDMRWAKPLDHELIEQLANSHKLIVTLEENSIAGGAGSGVTEYLSAQGILLPTLHLGLPDRYIDHGKREKILAAIGLDAKGIEESIKQRMQILGKKSNAPFNQKVF